MITKVNDTDLRVLSLFTRGYAGEYYIREVQKLLGVSSRTAFITLAKLETAGILTSTIKGKIKVYSIKKSIFSRDLFVLTEQYKKIRFTEEHPLITELLEKIDTSVEGIVIAFGSYVKGIQKDDSDLDLFIVGIYDKERIASISTMYGLNVSIKHYPLSIFEKELHTDILLKEIVHDHVVLRDAEGFVRRVMLWIV